MTNRMEIALLKTRPSGWFYVCEESQVDNSRPVAVQILGKKLVAFRDQNARLRITSASCPHFGADLAHACVKQGRLTCPFHGFQFNGRGQCVNAPGEKSIPSFARLRSYRCYVFAGSVFVFLGPKAKFCNLPGFAGESGAEYLFVKPVKVEIQAPWFMAGMNEFDTRHFESVHGRKVVHSPIHDFDADGLAFTDLKLQNVGQSILNRILRLFFGDQMRLQINNVMGLMKFAKTTFGPLHNRMVISIIPTSPKTAVAYIKVVGLKPKNIVVRLLMKAWLQLLSRASFAFFSEEVREVRGALYRSDRATARDQNVRRFMNWITELQVGASQSETPTVKQSARVELPPQSQKTPGNSSLSTQP